ncbi:hypothetical protein LXL04_025453 [Taraxacum kok-saghyz]
MVRAPCFDNHGIKRGAWSEEEDNTLRLYIQKYGHPNWRELPKLAGLSRCGKSCRLRWINYLRPNLRRGNFTKEEEDVILNLHKKLGSKWSVMAAQLPGRSDNEIKNHWHTHLKNRIRKDKIEQVGSHESTSKGYNPKGCPTERTDLESQEEVGVLIKVLSTGMSSSTTSEQSPNWLSDSGTDARTATAPDVSHRMNIGNDLGTILSVYRNGNKIGIDLVHP